MDIFLSVEVLCDGRAECIVAMQMSMNVTGGRPNLRREIKVMHSRQPPLQYASKGDNFEIDDMFAMIELGPPIGYRWRDNSKLSSGLEAVPPSFS